MHSSFWTYLKRALTVALILGPTLALVSVDVEARGGRGGGGGGRGGGGARHVAHGGGGGFGGGGREVRAPRANVGGGGAVRRPPWRWRIWGQAADHRGGRLRACQRRPPLGLWEGVGVGAAVAVGTAVAVGAMVSTLPPNCTTIIADGVTYRNCGGTYHAPDHSRYRN